MTPLRGKGNQPPRLRAHCENRAVEAQLIVRMMAPGEGWCTRVLIPKDDLGTNIRPLSVGTDAFPGLMDVKSEKPTYASVASPAPDTDADRRATDHGGDGADDSGSDVSTVPPSPALSLADLHAALTATAPTFPAYTLRATAAAPSKGRASYVRKFCRVLRTSTMPITGPLRRSWATARFLEAIQADPAWVGLGVSSFT